jgi:arsenate reductase
MKENGIDITQHNSNLVKEYINEHFDYIITLCDRAKARCLILASASLFYINISPIFTVPQALRMKF